MLGRVQRRSDATAEKAGDRVMEPTPVLVVEDDPDISTMLETALRRGGYLPTVVAAVPDALHALSTTTFAAVLTDYGVTSQTGRLVIEQAQRLKPTPVIVLMTGHSREILAAQLVDLTITAFLPKPFSLATLYATLEQCRAQIRTAGPAGHAAEFPRLPA
jgi:DNA-binding NtrC family response regulator